MLTVAFGYLRKVFVTNRELHRLLAEQEKARIAIRNAQHEENTGNFVRLFDKMGAVEQRIAHIEGSLSGRYPRMDR